MLECAGCLATKVQTYGDNGNAWMYCPLLPDPATTEGVVMRHIDAAVRSLPPKLVWEKLLDSGIPNDLCRAVNNLPSAGVLYDKSIVYAAR